MRPLLKRAASVALTLCMVAGAGVVAHGLWNHYLHEPWTRDARVRADVIGVAPDVSGLVSEVLVRDNAAVHRGDVLFRIDRQRFEIALQQATAALEGRRAALEQARRDLTRYEQIREVVSRQATEQARTAVAQAGAALDQATADQHLAELNLARSEVHASVSGTVTNLSLRPGDYVASGQAVMALVDSASLRVEGYFEETKLPRIRIGDPVTIHLMGQSPALTGHVQSFASAIEDRERSAGLVANINPSFTWVRLAQRVPVRIELGEVPEGVLLVAGLTATVEVQPRPEAATATP
ncbi:efflux RND transporter periplasmic adaptor subunit [Roseococcus pinisoli]|uniref:HlyD family secretion protein n=1 Tax=Roseococcus pinisoli TaxID=2835040 RepID=A0ABS5QC99_9PROT|nr:HlyD family secretion protein [Roseococcus pinisoli]MBS7811142.1 HlyD family secretion protein [Roseococcus pinisoli]